MEKIESQVGVGDCWRRERGGDEAQDCPAIGVVGGRSSKVGEKEQPREEKSEPSREPSKRGVSSGFRGEIQLHSGAASKLFSITGLSPARARLLPHGCFPMAAAWNAVLMKLHAFAEGLGVRARLVPLDSMPQVWRWVASLGCAQGCAGAAPQYPCLKLGTERPRPQGQVMG